MAWDILYTVYHPVPLHPLSIRQVSWSTAAMTFDPGTEQQGRGYQCWVFRSKKLNVQTAQEPHLEEEAKGVGSFKKRWTRVLGYIGLSPSHQCFWSHDHGRGANSAWLFTLLISGVVTSRGTHKLTSAHTHMQATSPWANVKKKKRS